jgi:hypothetical protein
LESILQPQTIFKPTVFILDLDQTTHTLFHKNRDNGTISYPIEISKSAEIRLSREEDGICEWYICKNDDQNTQICMQALAREEFKKILDRAYELQQQYRESPIVVKIITRGEYYPNEIKQAWDKFYSDGDQRFTKNLFPLEIFNCVSLKKFVYDKSYLMEENYYRWKKELPGLTRDRVCILDDDYQTILDVRKRGFSAIHFPTVASDRDEGVTFTHHGPKAFEVVHQLFDEAIGIESSHTPEQESTEENLNIFGSEAADSDSFQNIENNLTEKINQIVLEF